MEEGIKSFLLGLFIASIIGFFYTNILPVVALFSISGVVYFTWKDRKKEQERVISTFMEKRAYSKLYNKLSASLFPQMILLIDDCNAIEKKGCKREVYDYLLKEV